LEAVATPAASTVAIEVVVSGALAGGVGACAGVVIHFPHLQHKALGDVSVADGRSIRVPYVGPVKVRCQGRLCFVGALVLGDDVLLGAVPMEDMDLTINPSRQRLEPDPRSPNIPHALVKTQTQA
jgi:hypothetical protein